MLYRVLKCDVIKLSFFFAFQHFHDNISVEHDEKPSHTKGPLTISIKISPCTEKGTS